MRVFLLAAMLLASSSLCAFAQESGKAPAAAPQAGSPAQTDQNAPPTPDQKADREQPKSDNREMGPDWKMRRSDGDRMDRDDREKGHGGMMRRGDGDRMGYDRDKDRGRYQERHERDWDDADRYRSYRGYADADRPRRRVKICVEYDNGEEYCRYRQ
jgi:hypothetical protein